MKGSPNDENFSVAVGALYAMSYGIKMMPKKGVTPKGYFDYTVYPLEGVWALNEAGITDIQKTGEFKLQDLEYEIMIRQPDFVTNELALANLETVSAKKPNPNNHKIKFKEITEGLVVQILHQGPYSTEQESFTKLTEFCETNNLIRTQHTHREIYLSDPRKSAPEKNKTVLRYAVNRLA